MKYTYYPGCSLERNAGAYHSSTLAVAGPLGMEFQEVDDWNCCGATEFIAVDKMQAYALAARNLSLAEKQSNGNGATMVAPCSACFLNLSKCDAYLVKDAPLAEKVNRALAAGGLHYTPGSVRTRHLLEAMVTDVGFEGVAAQVKRPLYNLKVAPYYGCLIVRPGFLDKFDDEEYPTSLDKLMRTLGANVVDFPMKAHCCGGHMTQISEEVALGLIYRLLKNAADYGADVITTICPMCQLNLDAYQEHVNRYFGTHFKIPILYFTQLMGLAFDMDPLALGFGKEFIDAAPALAKIGVEPPPKPKRERPSKEALPMPMMPEEE
ncbi:MAG: CoB--CoM heterodisulfide reductase iron-sulfur subunit B family protein [Ardenticatenaceae bacterium]|nr:CoB--CoM heterodisulfide reductase iron-sulfur subunit B family protein [Anaerolineales bacterium]MCB8923755.1 CoB--CoM heterodisulfide reductase iron-sulfur subunit B family protein [Ardenticatenaceae bacterium]MCB8990090.1 CoB--CoM heterodisulfide reductase iron-sulfur subunit B family protein [Ardenticatenaceae bacterium]